MDFEGSQLWKRFKWELGGNRGSKLSAIIAFLSFTLSQVTQRVCIVLTFVFFFLWTVTAAILCKRFCVLKQWISNASLTVSPNPNQATTPPSSSSAYWQPGEMRCPAALSSTIQAVTGKGWGWERRVTGCVSGFGMAICLNCSLRIIV